MGAPPPAGQAAAAGPVAGDWYADTGHWAGLGARLAAEVTRYQTEHSLEAGAPLEALRHRLGLPDRALVSALLRPPLTVRGGRVAAGPGDVPDDLAARVAKAFDGLGDFAAPEGDDLAALGLGARELAAADRHGLLVRLAPAVALRPGSPGRAADVLAGLPQPFTLSAARRALGTTRRVAVPLLELLDRTGRTRRLPDDRRTVSG
jgi:selenocysteine-specific elongation factor